MPHSCEAPGGIAVKKSPLKRAGIALAAVALAVSIVAGCSSSSSKSSEAKYCDSWQKVVDSFSALDDIAITTSGLSGLDAAVEDITTASKDLASSADSLLVHPMGFILSYYGWPEEKFRLHAPPRWIKGCLSSRNPNLPLTARLASGWISRCRCFLHNQWILDYKFALG